MKLIIISGRSGSGKSTAIQVLEDIGFYCIDNLPAALLPETINYLLSSCDQDLTAPAPAHSAQPELPKSAAVQDKIALCIDARNPFKHLSQLPGIIATLKSGKQNFDIDFIYLDASDETLIQRYSATRRRHPMADQVQGLKSSIEYEKTVLSAIADMASIRIDTTHLSLYQLRDVIKYRVAERTEQNLSLQFLSFGFKHGVPLDADIVYDLRILPNPYWIAELRSFNGLEQPVIEFLEKQPLVTQMIDDIKAYLEKWLPHFRTNNRSYVTIALGCTGGQHRSVYIAEQLTGHFLPLMDNVSVYHREIKR
ncbi:MAG: RNase adapter RapZ [Pseudomonadales bacterium]|nr:RNase adapter RapZ [Pseudomonadales bacterium]NRA18676.1 RNase adapter RapZ [Oceanospirillaceae bacterium]